MLSKEYIPFSFDLSLSKFQITSDFEPISLMFQIKAGWNIYNGNKPDTVERFNWIGCILRKILPNGRC